MPVALNENSCKAEDARRRKLNAWFVERDILKKDVADAMAVSPQRLSAILAGRYVSSEYREALAKIGIPEALLPAVTVRKRPGPKPGKIEKLRAQVVGV